MNLQIQSDLVNKRAIITGGAGVICGEIAAFLAQAGAHVAILDLSGERAHQKAREISETCKQKIIGIGCNVLEKQSCITGNEQITAALGGADMLINGAGGNSPKATTKCEFVSDSDLNDLDQTFFGLDIDAFRGVFDLNFMGTLLPTMIFAKSMVQNKCGVVLNISSMNSYRPLTRIPAYSAAKASINNFTAWLAVHLSKQNVRVNAIAPGFLLTDQNRFLMTDSETSQLTPRGAKILAATPMNRFGTPGELLGAVQFLASDMSKFVTGIVIPVDGGFSAYSGV
jgi:NAD(P)-dependent dehydrogenase (short-subunit alcohol dehydrogenase family)